MRISILTLIIFLSIFLSVYGSVHYYLYRYLISAFNVSGRFLILLRLLFIFLFLSFPLVHFLPRNNFDIFTNTINYIGALWMGMVIYFFFLILFFDILRILLKLIGFSIDFYSVTPASIIVAAVVVITLYGFWEASNIGLTKIEIDMANLSKKLNGFTIVQISDVHMGRIIGTRRLEKIVDMINGLDPDLVVITGDLMDAEAVYKENLLEPLRRLKTRYGIYGVTGNHEYFAGIDRSVSFIEKAGVVMLRNRWVKVAEGLQLIGRDDPVAARVVRQAVPSLSNIAGDIDKTKPAILLYHTPVVTFEDLKKSNINLQISGHTHKGQLWPFNYIVKMVYKTPYGLFKSQDTSIYVSRGTGTWGPPIRVGAPPEITLIKLIAK